MSILTGWCDRILEAGALLSIPAAVLYFNVHAARGFEPDKLLLLLAFALVLGSTLLIRSVTAGFRFGRPAPLTLCLLAVGLSGLISTICSIDPRISWQGSYLRRDGLCTLYIFLTLFASWICVLRNWAAVERAVTTVVLCTLPVCGYAVVQRFGLDPLWGSISASQTGSTTGNAVALAGFLITAIPFLVYRCVSLLERWATMGLGQRLMVIGHGALLALVGAVMVSTSARGPTIALFLALMFAGWIGLRRQEGPVMGALDAARALAAVGAGLAFIGALLWGVVRLIGISEPAASFSVTLITLAVVLISIIVPLLFGRGPAWLRLCLLWLTGIVLIGGALLNVPPESLREVVPRPVAELSDSWRTIPWIWRFSRVLDPDKSTGKVRVLLWKAAVEQLSRGVHVEYPDGATDGLRSLRWLVGWGPDSEELTFPQFYPAELAYMEGANRVDRLHNQTFDLLVTSGALGLAAWHAVYLVAFLLALRQLGFGVGWRNVGGWIVGAAVASGLTLVLDSPYYAGVALPMGALLGLALSLSGRVEPTSGAHLRLSLACLVALVGQFLEVQVSFALVPSRVMMFFALALLQALERPLAEGHEGSGWAAVPIQSCILTTLALEFLSVFVFLARMQSRDDLPSAWTLWRHLGWTNGPARTTDDPTGLWLLVGSWLGMGLLVGVRNSGIWSRLVMLGVAPLVGLASARLAASALRMAYFWVWLIPGTEKIVVEEAVMMLQTGFQGYFLTIAAAWLVHGVWLALVLPDPKPGGEIPDVRAQIAVLCLAGMTAILIWTSCLRLTLADAMYSQAQNIQRSQAEEANDADVWRLPVTTMEAIVALAPGVDQYFSYLGDFLGRQAFLEKELPEQQHLRRRARQAMLAASELAPLEPNSANNVALSTLKYYRLLPGDAPERDQLLAEARKEYSRAVRLSPYDMGLRVEFGNRLLEEYGDLDGAADMYRSALQLDPRYYKAFYGLSAVWEHRSQAFPFGSLDRRMRLRSAAAAALLGVRYEPPGPERENRRKVMLQLHELAGLPAPAEQPIANP